MDKSGSEKNGQFPAGSTEKGQKDSLTKPGRSTSRKVDLYVVVADDDVDDHKLITRAVKDCGGNHLVTSVYNGMQLMNLLLRKGFYKVDFHRQPDIIILDLKMPVMDGYEVLKQLATHPELKKIPVYILSDATLEEDIKKARQLGGDRFYSKPFSYEALKNLMTDICTEGLRLSRKHDSEAQ
jgi:two-component system response regulator